MLGLRLTVIAASLILLAFVARAQETVHRIGFLGNFENAELERPFLDGLRALGYVVGKNLLIEFRYSRGEPDRANAPISELLTLRPEMIVANAPQNAIAAYASSPATPLVFIAVADPVAV